MKKKTVTLSKENFLYLLDKINGAIDSSKNSIEYYEERLDNLDENSKNHYEKEKINLEKFLNIRDDFLGLND